MKRSTAGRAIRDSSLRPNERLVMFALLDRANNDDCAIPHWLAPSLTGVAHDTGLSRSTAAAVVAHLELHGWLRREGQKAGQMPKTKLSGRMRSTTRWGLLPDDFVPGDCSCAKPDSPRTGPSKRQIVRVEHHLDSPGGVTISAGQNVDGSEGRRDEGSSRKGVSEAQEPQPCIGCGKKPRRGCRTCWDCPALEISDGRMSA